MLQVKQHQNKMKEHGEYNASVKSIILIRELGISSKGALEGLLITSFGIDG